ncbi:DUF6461 domain-containing protein [Streptomyces sp. NPDC001091]
MSDGIGWLLEPYLVDCVTFASGIPPAALAARLGSGPGEEARPGSAQDAQEALGSGARCVARVGEAAGWAFAVEYGDAVGATAGGLAAVSRGGVAAVNFLLTPWSPPSLFHHYLDGAYVTGFGVGEEARRFGAEPGLLVPALEALGVLPSGPQLDQHGLRLTMLAIQDHFGLRLPQRQVLDGKLPMYHLR